MTIVTQTLKMKFKFIPDQNIKEEINLIKTSIDENEKIVFIYTGKNRLNNYIKRISNQDDDEELDNSYY